MTTLQPSEQIREPDQEQLRVFLDELPWDVRSRNMDWRYVRFSLPLLARYEQSLELIMQQSRWITARENISVLWQTLARRAGLRSVRSRQTSTLSASDLARSGARVVFAHRAFPLNGGAVPTVWQNCILDPDMQLAFGATQDEIDAEIGTKGKLYRLATAVQVSTEAEAERLGRYFPDIADRFVAVPFFTPHVHACEQESLQKHLEPGPVRILFTGNQAWRKGLDLLLEAFLGLDESLQKRAELTVISNFVPPAVALPVHRRITILRGADNARVMQEMARSHIFVNVARFESYGLVFHEAMSQGLACLAPNWEVQRELFDNGAAGRLLSPRADAIRLALEELIPDPQQRFRLGTAAWLRFRRRYAPEIVARQYAKLFHSLAAKAD